MSRDFPRVRKFGSSAWARKVTEMVSLWGWIVAVVACSDDLELVYISVSQLLCVLWSRGLSYDVFSSYLKGVSLNIMLGEKLCIMGIKFTFKGVRGVIKLERGHYK